MDKRTNVSLFLILIFWLAQSSALTPFAHWRAPNQLDPSWTPQWSGLKAYWRMNGTAGAIANGATLSEYFGTSNGTASSTGLSYVSGGRIQQATSYNGSTYFTVSRTSPANVCTSMTWMTWIKWNAPASPSWANLITNWNGCAADASWNVNQAGDTKKIEVTFNTTAGFNQYVDSTATPLDGNWHHIAITITSGGSVVMYIDGVSNATLSVNMGAGICSPTANMKIAGGDCASPLGSGAIMDEMAIWNVSLSAAEVLQIYNRQKDGGY